MKCVKSDISGDSEAVRCLSPMTAKSPIGQATVEL